MDPCSFIDTFPNILVVCGLRNKQIFPSASLSVKHGAVGYKTTTEGSGGSQGDDCKEEPYPLGDFEPRRSDNRKTAS